MLPTNFYGLVIAQERRISKYSKPYWQVMLKTIFGSLKCVMWGCTPDAETNNKYPHVGDCIKVTNFKDQLEVEGKGSVVIIEFSRIDKKDLPEDNKVICEIKQASTEDLYNAAKVINDKTFWENDKYFEFTKACLTKINKDDLLSCPAATGMHHNYKGGLLIHTAEVLKLCKGMAEAMEDYKLFNKDVLYCSAILHDLGKIKTYFIDEAGMPKQRVEEKTIGHVYYSVYLAQQMYENGWKDKIEEKFINEVLHCISSHHERPEYGAIKVPQSLEAIMLSRADSISSRFGIILAHLETIPSKQELAEDFKAGDNYFTTEAIKKYYDN